MLANSAADATSAQFTFNAAAHTNSSFTVSVLSGTHSLKDVTITDNKASTYLFSMGLVVDFTNVNVT